MFKQSILKAGNGLANIDSVLSYNNLQLIERIQEKEGMSFEEASLLFKDMLRFLFLCGTRDEIMAPTKRIDIAWHHFILFTIDYRKFCFTFFKKFINHQPTSKEQKVMDRAIGFNPGTNSLRLAKEIFGELSQNWNYATSSDDCTPTTNCQDPDCCAKPAG